MPQVFSLDDNLEETLTFLSFMRQRILSKATEIQQARATGNKRRRSKTISGYFDFSSMREMGVSAALVLASIYDRSKFLTGERLHTIDEHRWDPGIRSMLHAVGFHEFLEMQKAAPSSKPIQAAIILPFGSPDLNKTAVVRLPRTDHLF